METDVCVLATVLGAVDLGYRVIVVNDGDLAVPSDEGHDARLRVYHGRLHDNRSKRRMRKVLRRWDSGLSPLLCRW